MELILTTFFSWAQNLYCTLENCGNRMIRHKYKIWSHILFPGEASTYMAIILVSEPGSGLSIFCFDFFG